MVTPNPTDDFNDFLRFLNRALGPDAVCERAGASASEINQFIELAGLPLPPLYLCYLHEFGQKDKTLMMADDTDARVATLLEFYKEEQGDSDTLIPENGVVIGAYGVSGERALIYKKYDNNPKASPHEPEEPMVVACDYGETMYICARTFRNHIYRQAFIRGRLRTGALFSLRRNEEKLIPSAREVLENIGFQAYWFSDEYQVCMERDDGGTIYIKRTPGRTSLYGCFQNSKTSEELKLNLIRQLVLLDSNP